ncbi:MAG: UDP-N-acetylmuramoyl-L-alanine--D-glutamate ligase [Flavobacteriales bacterium]|nr:MAG: UDP-N-acetylmuramoyl-L-alanine--D-glutamate ligase [Flavobacteriales bacterium TMED96]RZP12147.1 MAG: UDP-N-acetylmuramoyl-L-alanine--D-glutamate ligase [Flavobacteriales bacterium]
MKGLIAILGSGESGKGAAILAKKAGYQVFVSDLKKIPKQTKSLFKKLSIDYEENHHSIDKIIKAEKIIKSPGIDQKSDLIVEIRKSRNDIISEIEFGFSQTDSKIIGVTGSNGKTTTATMIYHILKKSGFDVALAGNIGRSFSGSIADQNHKIYVLEISSFQLDNILNFSPDISVITSITPDHLDRYNYDFDEYIKSKLNITLNQSINQFLIFNSDDKVLRKAVKRYAQNVTQFPYGFNPPKRNLVTTVKKKSIIVKEKKNINMYDTLKFSLKGRHNLLNAMAAVSVARLLKVSNKCIRDSLISFSNVEHRLEEVLKIQNITYINDSKATNVNATFYALESMEGQTVWIVGGIDKGNNYIELLPLVREKVKSIICIGLDNEKIIESFSPVVDVIVETQSMSEAVKIAHNLANKKDYVLLSPACASFDLFKNFEDRGNQFKQAVRNL